MEPLTQTTPSTPEVTVDEAELRQTCRMVLAGLILVPLSSFVLVGPETTTLPLVTLLVLAPLMLITAKKGFSNKKPERKHLSIRRESEPKEWNAAKYKGNFRLTACFYLACAIGMAVLAGIHAEESKRTMNWPSVPGTIVRRDFSTSDSGMKRYFYTFSYSIDGKSHLSSSQSLYKVRGSLDCYQNGDSVTVHFDPSNPDVGVLQAGGDDYSNGWAMGFFVFASFIFVCSFAAVSYQRS